MAEVTKPIMLDETGQALITKINELKNVLAPSGTLNITQSGTYDVSEKASAVVDIPDWLAYATNPSGLFSGANFDRDVDITFANASSFENCFGGANLNGHKLKVKINGTHNISCASAFVDTQNSPDIEFDWGTNTITNMGNAFRDGGGSYTNKKKIILKGQTSLSSVTNWYQAFKDCTTLETIEGDLNFSGVSTSVAPFFDCYSLKDITIVPNTTICNLLTNRSKLLTTDSLVSIANSLQDGISGKTLTLSPDQTFKSRCESILGTVTTVDGVNTFTASESGTVAFTDFITDYKGWSLA